MASEKLKAVRAVPRAMAKEFCENRYFVLMLFALSAQCAMGIVNLARDILGGEDILITVFSASMILLLGYVAVTFAGLRTRQDQKSAKRAAVSVLIYCIILFSYVFIMGSTYYTMTGIIRSGEVAELEQQAVDQWNAMLPFSIFSMAVILVQGVVYGLMFRALNDVKEMTTGRYPQRNAFTAVSILAALSTGMVLCNIFLGVRMAWGDVLSVVMVIVTTIPDLLFNFSCAQLCRHMSLRRKGAI